MYVYIHWLAFGAARYKRYSPTQDLPNVALGPQRSLAIITSDHITDARHHKAELKMQRQITSDMISTEFTTIQN